MTTKFKRHGRGKGAYVLVPITRGLLVAVSPKDAERVSKHWWRVGSTNSKGCIENVSTCIRGKHVMLSRFILHLCAKDKRTVDHHNRNPLDNRRINLRVCTMSENNRNRKRHYYGRMPISSFRGVYRNLKATGAHGGCLFRAEIRYRGKIHCVGMFKTEKEAALAYDNYAREKLGQFATPNFPKKSERPPKPPKEVTKLIPNITNRHAGQRRRKSLYVGVKLEQKERKGKRRNWKEKWRWIIRQDKKFMGKNGFSSELAAAKDREEYIIKNHLPHWRNFSTQERENKNVKRKTLLPRRSPTIAG